MDKDFTQTAWNDTLKQDLRELLRLAVREDSLDVGDCTSQALVPERALGRAAIVARQDGIIAGLAAVETILEAFDPRLVWNPRLEDARPVGPGDVVGQIEGPARSLLTAERVFLNLLGRLSGIATLTRRYVDAVSDSKARIYDTRKTTPGWRRLEKYAVRCGGGRNHRTGLFDAVLIKDNHLAFGADVAHPSSRYTPARAVVKARDYLLQQAGPEAQDRTIVEIEADTLDQLDSVLPVSPDIVLLDNMSPAELIEAVRRRDAAGHSTDLEASGGVNLDTIGAIAKTGVDRISVGALTHSAVCLDIGLDWLEADSTPS